MKKAANLVEKGNTVGDGQKDSIRNNGTKGQTIGDVGKMSCIKCSGRGQHYSRSLGGGRCEG